MFWLKALSRHFIEQNMHMLMMTFIMMMMRSQVFSIFSNFLFFHPDLRPSSLCSIDLSNIELLQILQHKRNHTVALAMPKLQRLKIFLRFFFIISILSWWLLTTASTPVQARLREIYWEEIMIISEILPWIGCNSYQGWCFFCTLYFAKIMIVMMLMVNVVIMMEAKICSAWGWLIAQLDNLCYCWLSLGIDFYPDNKEI